MPNWINFLKLKRLNFNVKIPPRQPFFNVQREFVECKPQKTRKQTDLQKKNENSNLFLVSKHLSCDLSLSIQILNLSFSTKL